MTEGWPATSPDAVPAAAAAAPASRGASTMPCLAVDQALGQAL